MVINSLPTSTDVEPLYSRQLRSQTSACKVPSRHALWLQMQVASDIIAGFSTELCDFTHHSFSTFFFCASIWTILWKNSRKDKEMKQTKKPYTEITNQHWPSSCSLALRFTSSFCAKCKGKDIGADASVGSPVSTGRQQRTKNSGRTCSAVSTSTCWKLVEWGI